MTCGPSRSVTESEAASIRVSHPMEVDGCTWLTQRKVPQQQMLARYFLLVACLSGIVLKVLVVSAPVVRTARRFLLHFKRQRGVTNHEIGAAVILSLRGYAKMAQEAVQKLALRWRRLGQTKWGAGQLRALMLAWQKIEQTHGKLHAKKVQGLSNRYFGAAWLQKVLAAPDWKTRWDEACEHVGAMCRDPHFASTFRESCKVLAQLPGVGVDYGSKWMVRGGYVLREWVWHAPPLPMTEKEVQQEVYRVINHNVNCKDEPPTIEADKAQKKRSGQSQQALTEQAFPERFVAAQIGEYPLRGAKISL